ncbi:hypothetical protein CC1G_15658 [Coprinopsis cinerea okayama7|uniref:Uncharacterized protein n=1 Tax=Coprinopsis cinerea (strain Okayama-7 / 130 / ATCC MYA-4618 / FGSC 9003) TaxID=240176 RepID=D6RQB8_COPC7|nr:hypothetical protein CC1G_15658 [Coprinopsis cinerea okayama7\|eukprot:XP_002910228.1 hypothetical protein CC1G_15658 [Coprinopsis cinerea okayama7\
MGLRRDHWQRLSFILILLGILFFLSVLLYSGRDRFAKAYDSAKPAHWKTFEDETVGKAPSSNCRGRHDGRSALVSTRELTTIPSVTLPGGCNLMALD